MTKHSERLEWLKALQLRSWELELLLVGFSIFLLARVPSALDQAGQYFIKVNLPSMLMVFTRVVFSGAKYSAWVVTFNLIVHVIIRGFWIGLVGLSATFSEQTKLDHLTKLIVRLNMFCGSLFAFTFLIAGIVMSVCLFVFVGIVFGFLEMISPDYARLTTILGTLKWIWTAMGLLVLSNIALHGKLGKARISNRILHFVDLIISRITLSFVYRSLFHTLTTRYGYLRIMSIILVYLTVIGSLAFRINDTYYPLADNSIQYSQYDELRPDASPITTASIKEVVVTDDHIEVFIPLRIEDYAVIREESSFLGIEFFGISAFSPDIDEKIKVSIRILERLNRIIEVEINDRLQDITFLYKTHEITKQKGLFTVMPLDDSFQGKCELAVYRKQEEGRQLKAMIPFWRMPPIASAKNVQTGLSSELQEEK